MDFFDKFTDTLPNSMGREPVEHRDVRRRGEYRGTASQNVPSNDTDINEELDYVPDDEYDGREV